MFIELSNNNTEAPMLKLGKHLDALFQIFKTYL